MAGLAGTRVIAEPDPRAALDRTLSGSPATGPIVVAGSLYLVGAARSLLVDDPDLRDPDPSEDR
jgi:folylpolyglutamate synthase/dihydropteroate synthase